MDCTTKAAPKLNVTNTHTLSICCVPQILVIDRQNGPADIFMDIIGRMANRDLSITSAYNSNEAEHALAHCSYDLVVMGLDDRQFASLDMIPTIRAQIPDLPVIVIGDRYTERCAECIQKYGAREYIALPDRAADLKTAVKHIRDSYL